MSSPTTLDLLNSLGLKPNYCDTEFNQSSDPKMNVVCASFLSSSVNNFWTNEGNYESVKDYLQSLPPNTVIVAYAAEAEASAFISMGIDPLKFKWIDLQLEAKMLYNHNNLLVIGKHIQEGREIFIKPKIGQYGKVLIAKPPTSLASVLLRFLDIKIDIAVKDKMRDIILTEDNALIEKNKSDIMKYCQSDVALLPKLLEKILFWHRKCTPSYKTSLVTEMLLRGEYSVRTAMMVREGLPINMEWAKNLASNVPIALQECIKDINSQFETKPFKFDKKTAGYVMDTKVLRQWISDQGFSNWPLTDGGVTGNKQLSLALEAWEEFFNYRHEFPRHNLGAQMVRYLKLKQSLNSFNMKNEEKSFFNTIGSDGRSRPFFNHYGSQSSRTQPKSTGFLFLKGAWTRALAQPPEGYVIGAIDYGSQEFLIGAIQSKDKKMIEAYASGDVYLAYGKEIGVIPKDGTKKTHSKERDAQKPVILGWLYQSTGYSLSYELTNQTGRRWTPEEAQPLLDRLDHTYSRFYNFRQEIVNRYNIGGHLRLSDGWVLFGNNPSFRSVSNFVTQGMGAVIMRRAVALAQNRGLTILQTLHDSLYILSNEGSYLSDMDLLHECMKQAFIESFDKDRAEVATLIRMDCKAWGPIFPEEDTSFTTDKGRKVSCSKYHIDPRSKNEYKVFSPFFHIGSGTELL